MFKKLSNTSKQREDGQGLVEYALILVLVSVVVVVVLSQMGPAVGNIFSGVVGALNGGAVAEEEEEEVECHPYHFSQYMEVPSNNYMPAGRQVWSRGECSDTANGSFQVETSSKPRVHASSQSEALAICNNHGSFSSASKPSSYNIWDCN